MYKIAICDDDKEYLVFLKNKIMQNGEFAENTQFFLYTSGEQLLADKEQGFDLVFLDMEMKKFDGYETASRLRLINEKFVLAFCTGIRLPMPEFFRVQPYRYLMKQFEEAKLDGDIKELLIEMKRRGTENYFSVVCDGKATQINTRDIIYISKIKRGSLLTVTKELQEKGISQSLKSKEALGDIYEELQEYGFEYVNSSTLINLRNIVSTESDELIMNNQERLYISRAYKEKFYKRWTEYMGKKYRRRM